MYSKVNNPPENYESAEHSASNPRANRRKKATDARIPEIHIVVSKVFNVASLYSSISP